MPAATRNCRRSDGYFSADPTTSSTGERHGNSPDIGIALPFPPLPLPGEIPSGHKGYGTSKYCSDLFGCFNGFDSSRLRPALLDRLKASVYGSDCEVLPITATGMRITATAKWTIRQGGDRCLAEREGLYDIAQKPQKNLAFGPVCVVNRVWFHVWS
jgi:hypothetical protein